MSANPYDRRQRGPRDHLRGAGADWANVGMLAGDGPRESPIALQDLEALTDNAHRRGAREADERHTRELFEARLEARREAWQEGHDVGEADGRSDLLARIDDRCSGEVHAAIKATKAMLEELEADGRRVPKSDLQDRLVRLTRLFEWLVSEHHNEFVEIPF